MTEAKAIRRRNLDLALCVVALAAVVAALCGAAWAESADDVFERGKNLAAKKHYAEAIETMQDFQRKFRDDARAVEAQYLVGRYEQERNYLNAALKEYAYLIKEFPRTVYAARAYRHTADIYVQTEQPDKAVQSLEDLAEKFKGTEEAFHGLRHLGEVQLQRKDEGAAAAAFKRVIDYNVLQLLDNCPKESQAGINEDLRRGVFFLADRGIAAKDYDAARYAYSRLPDKWEKVRLAIDLLYQQEKLAEIYDMIHEMEGEDYWQAQNIMLELSVKRGAMNGLVMQIRKLTEDNEAGDELEKFLRRFTTATGKLTDEQRRTLFELIAARYRPLRRTFEFEVCKLTWKEEPDGLQRFILTYEKGPDVEQCKRWRGIYLEVNKEREKAIEQYRLMEDKAQGHFYVAESYHGEHARQAGTVDLPGAIKEYMEIRKRFYDADRTCEAYWRTGQIYVEMGEKDKAVASLTELEERFVTEPDWQVRARFQVAEWYREWKMYDEAVEAYRSVDKLYPKTPQQQQSVYNIGLCYEALGDKDKAVHAFLECIRRFEKTKVQSDAHSRLEVKYQIPDVQIHDMIEKDEE